jgi:hypothetical protein
MTKLAGRKRALNLETTAEIRGRRLCVKVQSSAVIIWEKGLRTRYFVPWNVVYYMGAKLAARERLESRL